MERREMFKIFFGTIPRKSSFKKESTEEYAQKKWHWRTREEEPIFKKSATTDLLYLDAGQEQVVHRHVSNAHMLPGQYLLYDHTFHLAAVLQYTGEVALPDGQNDYAGFRFVIKEKKDSGAKQTAAIDMGIMANGYAFIGKKKSTILLTGNLLNAGVTLKASLQPQSSGKTFVKLTCLDHAGNTVCILTSEDYESNEWTGSVGIVSECVNAIDAEKPVIFSHIMINHETHKI